MRVNKAYDMNFAYGETWLIIGEGGFPSKSFGLIAYASIRYYYGDEKREIDLLQRAGKVISSQRHMP